MAKASVGTSEDVDKAVKAARNAFKTMWGLSCPGSRRGQLLQNLALLVEKHQDELVALEALNAGMSVLRAHIPSVSHFRGVSRVLTISMRDRKAVFGYETRRFELCYRNFEVLRWLGWESQRENNRGP